MSHLWMNGYNFPPINAQTKYKGLGITIDINKKTRRSTTPFKINCVS